MRSFLTLAIALLLGCGQQPTTAPNSQTRTSQSNSAPSTPSPTKPARKLSVDQGILEFPPADWNEEKTLEFVLRNEGTESLDLELATKSCGCTQVRLEPAHLEPGRAGKAVLHWKPLASQLLQDQIVRVTAEIRDRTDSATQVRIEGLGKAAPRLRVHPPELPLTLGTLHTATLKEMKLFKFEVFVQSAKDQGFTLEATTTHPGLQIATPPSLLSEEQRKLLKASFGYSVSLVVDKSLPLGQISEHVRLRTTLYPEQEILIPVVGQHTSAAVAVRPHELRGLRLDLETAQDRHVELTLFDSEDRMVVLRSVSPDWLRVQVEKSADRRNHWRIRIRIPSAQTLRETLDGKEWNDIASFQSAEGSLVLESSIPGTPTIVLPIHPIRAPLPTK